MSTTSTTLLEEIKKELEKIKDIFDVLEKIYIGEIEEPLIIKEE